VSRFVLTRQWLSEALVYSDTAAQVTLRGDEMRAVLRAAWQGMGYADPPIEVIHHAPGENPTWPRYHPERSGTERHAEVAPTRFRVVPTKDNKQG
jgi:hypothetical protein